ncbi:type VI secretion system baseplate subunit TssE, partial [Legionella quinlivanii]|uniref:type VI secretion system baseplate subunit TssE n=1 Tax=Legionella quinlivanii TaxID=45073 RepID=UPI001A94D99A
GLLFKESLVRGERLTERLRRWARKDSKSLDQSEPEILVESIRKHIEQILSTRQGNAPIDENYGLSQSPALVEDYSLARKEELAEHLSHLIKTYEPRVAQVRISNLIINPDKQLITCHIDGTLKKPFEEISVYFTTILTSHGRVIVRL